MASATKKSCKRALVIGIDEYSDPSSSLTTCVNDAKDLSTALSRIGSNAHDRFNVSSAFNCTHAAFQETLNILIKTIQKGDIVLFYFAGHAEEYNGENYLLPSDYNYDHSMSETDYREKYAINAQYILHRINSTWAHVTIFILDCCRTKRTRTIHMNGLSPMNTPPETLIVFSCAPGKGALDDALNNKNSVFAQNLLRHIETSNEDIETMFMNVARDVKKQTHDFQTPCRQSSLTEKIFLFTKKSEGKVSLCLWK
jgi:uncharacterized caspase-like protein